MTREAITQLLKGSAPQTKSVGQSFSLIATNKIIEQIRYAVTLLTSFWEVRASNLRQDIDNSD